jgi:electron transport complex protein RnfC
VVPTKYPSGGEKQLIQLLTGKEVPSGSIPAQVGVVCQNVGTALAIHRAIELGEPLISRITTLTGNALKEPGNVEVLVGTPVSHLVACAGVDSARVARLVMGGPMMGFALHTPQVPVVKTSNCIIAATATEMPEPAPEQPCIRCGSCAEVCPADLLPQQLYWYSKNSDLERAQQYHLLDCIECGACAYVCPSNIPLVQYYRYAKGEIREQIAEQQKADKARIRFEARQARLEKEAAEKEARRKARLAGNKPAPAATGVDVATLKAASLEASSAYKAAVKALKEAEANGADDLDTLRANVDALKAKADAAKSAVREAGTQSRAPAAAPQDDLKKAMLEASSAYKAAVKAAKEAEQSGDANAAELRAQADALKTKADALKAQLRDAASGAAPAPAAATASAPAPAPAAAEDPVAERAQKMKTLKTRYNSLHEANAALERAERDGADNLDEQRTRVADLLKQAEEAKAQLNELVDAAKAGIRASGSDLKTMKLEAARAESALRSKEQELADAKKSADEERINVLYQERDMLRREVETATHALQSALKEQGLSE